MKPTIHNKYDKDDICSAEISYYINIKVKTNQGKTIKTKVLHHIENIIFCEGRINQFDAMLYARKLTEKQIAGIVIITKKTIG